MVFFKQLKFIKFNGFLKFESRNMWNKGCTSIKSNIPFCEFTLLEFEKFRLDLSSIGPVLTYLFIYLLSPLLTWSIVLVPLLLGLLATYLFPYLLTYLFPYLLIYLFPYLLTCSLTYLLTWFITCSLTYLLVPLLTY
jgi:hypothetical protein